MKRNILIGVMLLIVFAALLYAGSFTPLFATSQHSVGGEVHPGVGIMYWERTCLGIPVNITAADAEWTKCIGVVTGEKKCYGRESLESEIEELSCDNL